MGEVAGDIENGQVNLAFKDVQGTVVHSMDWNTGDRERPPTGGAGGHGGQPNVGGGAAGAPGVGGRSPVDDEVTSEPEGSDVNDTGTEGDDDELSSSDSAACGCRVPTGETKHGNTLPIVMLGFLGLLLGLRRRVQR